MIKILEKKPVPKATVTCRNCGSLLEYSNADLHEDYKHNNSASWPSNLATQSYVIVCPVCGVIQSASWIYKK